MHQISSVCEWEWEEGEKLKDEAKSADAADLKRSFDLTHGTCFNRSPQMPHREQKVGTADLNQAREAWGSGYTHFGQDNPMSSPCSKTRARHQELSSPTD